MIGLTEYSVVCDGITLSDSTVTSLSLVKSVIGGSVALKEAVMEEHINVLNDNEDMVAAKTKQFADLWRNR